jgi:threonine/homoserine/homoserine lactone efflux protein
MPSQAVSLALAASIYPPALAAVIALGRGTDVRLRVFLLVITALVTVYVTGCLMLVLFVDLGATSRQQHSVSAALYLLVGAVLVWVALRLRRKRPGKPKQATGSSRTERYLQSRRLVVLLGFIPYARHRRSTWAP